MTKRIGEVATPVFKRKREDSIALRLLGCFL